MLDEDEKMVSMVIMAHHGEKQHIFNDGRRLNIRRVAGKR